MLHDVAVVGAGPVGSTLALALAAGGVDVTVLDGRGVGEMGRSDRSLALSLGARLILERVGVWNLLSVAPQALTPILRIDISQAGGFGQVLLAAEEHGIPALGYVVSLSRLAGALDAALLRDRVPVRHGVEVTAVRGTPEHASVELKDGAAPVEAPIDWHDWRRSPTAPARRCRASRGDGAITGRSRSSPSSGPPRRTKDWLSSASRRMARWRSCPRTIVTGSCGPRHRTGRGPCSTSASPISWPSSRVVSARGLPPSRGSPGAVRFRSCSNSPPSPRARAALRSATRRKRCIRSRDRASTWGCATRGSSRPSCWVPRARRSARPRCSGAIRAAGAPIECPASRSRTRSSGCSATMYRSSAGREGWHSLCSTPFPPAKRAFTRAMLFGVR